MQNYIFYNVEHEKNLVIADMSKHFFLLQNQNQIGRCNCDFYWNILWRWKVSLLYRKYYVYIGVEILCILWVFFSGDKLLPNENVSTNINK